MHTLESRGLARPWVRGLGPQPRVGEGQVPIREGAQDGVAALRAPHVVVQTFRLGGRYGTLVNAGRPRWVVARLNRSQGR